MENMLGIILHGLGTSGGGISQPFAMDYGSRKEGNKLLT